MLYKLHDRFISFNLAKKAQNVNIHANENPQSFHLYLRTNVSMKVFHIISSTLAKTFKTYIRTTWVKICKVSFALVLFLQNF